MNWPGNNSKLCFSTKNLSEGRGLGLRRHYPIIHSSDPWPGRGTGTNWGSSRVKTKIPCSCCPPRQSVTLGDTSGTAESCSHGQDSHGDSSETPCPLLGPPWHLFHPSDTVRGHSGMQGRRRKRRRRIFRSLGFHHQAGLCWKG